MIRRGDEHRVDGLLLLQHLTEIDIVRAAEVRRLLSVVLLDLRLHWQATAHAFEVKVLQG
jgi:hypothetical protein